VKKIICVNLGDACVEVEDYLRAQGWSVVCATDLPEAQRLLAQASAQVGVLQPGNLSATRLAAVEEIVRSSPAVDWVGVFTPQALDCAVFRQLVLNCLFDYHTLPVDWRVLDLTLGHAFRRSRLRERDETLPEVIDTMGMVGSSAAIGHLRQQIRKVCQSEAPVLIGGESGTGKELAARAIHQGSARASGPFVAVNCGAISPSLIHSELFGHERGSFTGATAGKQGLIESANGGTLFLDEITDLPLELQTNLLRFLQERTIHRVGSTRSLEVNARVIAASHVELSQAVAAGRFREDLFYRLHVLPITVPSLRERLADVPILAQHFLRCCRADRHRRPVEGFSRQAIESLLSHDWPGNVRELFNRVQRAVVMTDQRFITPADLGFAIKGQAVGPGLDEVRTLAERNAISLTLGRVGRNITHAARELGVSRMTLYRLMDKHGLAHQMQ